MRQLIIEGYENRYEDQYSKIGIYDYHFENDEGEQVGPSRQKLSVDTHDAVAAVVYNVEERAYILVEQFRFPVVGKTGNGMLLELPAGKMGEEEQPYDAVVREVEEETGYKPRIIEHLVTVFASPGYSSERIHIYTITVSNSDRIGVGGGVGDEDVRVREVKRADVNTFIKEGKIVDMKTVLGLGLTV